MSVDADVGRSECLTLNRIYSTKSARTPADVVDYASGVSFTLVGSLARI